MVKLIDLPNERYKHSSIEVAYRSFIIGGQRCRKISEYKNKEFEDVAEMENDLFHFAVCQFDKNSIIIAGGVEENITIKKCTIFNINTFGLVQ